MESNTDIMIIGTIISDMECPWQPPAALASPAAAVLPLPPWEGPCSHLPYILAVTLSVNLLPLLYYRPSDGRLDRTALACTQREHERFVLIATSSRSLSLCISRTCDIDIIAVLCVLAYSYLVAFNLVAELPYDLGLDQGTSSIVCLIVEAVFQIECW